VPAREAFDYAIIRVVPRVERGERVNAGVILHCHARSYLVARIALDERRLLALAPDVDLALVRAHLDAIPRACAGEGPIGALPLRERWSWLVAPRSSIIQTSRPHVGLCDTPDAALDRLIDALVRIPAG
jgi:hypothetical protein